MCSLILYVNECLNIFQDGGKHMKALISSTVVYHIEKKESINIQMLVSSPFLLLTPSFIFCYDLT